VLAGASLRDADLGDARLVRADLTDADLEHATLDRADARYVTLHGARLYAADLADVELLGADLSAAGLPSARLSRASLVGARLADADLRVVELDAADLTHADLRDADLRGANVADAVFHCARVGPEALAQAEGSPAISPPVTAEKETGAHCGWVEDTPAAGAGQPVDASEHAAGRQLFTLCAPCHSLQPEFHKRGPSLAAVYGRRAGSLPDFAYSRALQLAEIDWNHATLDRYLADPKAFIPRSEMLFVGLPEPGERAALIAYLAAVKSGAPPGEPGPRALPPCRAP
jgi:cytochrome c